MPAQARSLVLLDRRGRCSYEGVSILRAIVHYGRRSTLESALWERSLILKNEILVIFKY